MTPEQRKPYVESLVKGLSDMLMDPTNEFQVSMRSEVEYKQIDRLREVPEHTGRRRITIRMNKTGQSRDHGDSKDGSFKEYRPSVVANPCAEIPLGQPDICCMSRRPVTRILDICHSYIYMHPELLAADKYNERTDTLVREVMNGTNGGENPAFVRSIVEREYPPCW